MKKTILVFNGIHGAGKTTLAKNLAERHPSTFIFYPEIGGQLRQEVDYNSLESGEDFDREVMRRELERDEMIILQSPGKIPLIETWHFGNIGYVAVRSPGLISEYIRALKIQLQFFRPIPVFVDISWQVFRSRITERIKPTQVEELINFYRGISDEIRGIYNEFNIDYILIRNDGELNKSIKLLEGEIQNRMRQMQIDEHGREICLFSAKER